MRILTVMTNSLEFNGISMSLLNYYKNLNKSKFQMDFAVPNKVDTKIKSVIEDNGNVVYELTSNNEKMRLKKPVKYIRKLRKIIRQGNYDIVHAHGNSATLFLELYAARKENIKIRIAHSRNTMCDHKILDKIFRPFFYKSYTHELACGKEAGEWLFNNENFFVINNGKDVDEFKFNPNIREEYRKKYGLENKKVIGHVGNMWFQKNHEYLIKVFNELVKLDDSYRLLLLGDGALRSNIENMVKEYDLDDKVFFFGKTSDVANLLQAMDIMVFPSRFEGFPNVLVEWQIAGLPSVISDKITKDVKLTNLVDFMSIDEEPKTWAVHINEIKLEDREKNQVEILEQIKRAGFDIKENTRYLESLYDRFYNELES